MRDALKAARDALEIIAAQHSGEVASTKRSDCMAAIASAALAQADAALAAPADVVEDAERLDYIEQKARRDPKMDGMHVWWPTSFNHRLVGPTLRAAIDRARKEQA